MCLKATVVIEIHVGGPVRSSKGKEKMYKMHTED
jgi:hypothetical protein